MVIKNVGEIVYNIAQPLGSGTLFLLTHYSPVLLFYTPWKHQKTLGFLMFSGGMEK